MFGENFDRNGAVQTRVPGAINLTHAARTDRRQDLVRPQLRAGGQGPCWLSRAAHSNAEALRLLGVFGAWTAGADYDRAARCSGGGPSKWEQATGVRSNLRYCRLCRSESFASRY